MIWLILFGCVTCKGQNAPLLHIRQNGEVKQFFVDDKPFIMLAGQLHNSGASSSEYMQPIWERLAALHVNTVIGTARFENPQFTHMDPIPSLVPNRNNFSSGIR